MCVRIKKASRIEKKSFEARGASNVKEFAFIQYCFIFASLEYQSREHVLANYLNQKFGSIYIIANNSIAVTI